MTLPPATDPTRKRIVLMAQRPEGMHRKDIRGWFNSAARQHALEVFDALVAHGHLVYVQEGRAVTYFAAPTTALKHVEAPKPEALVIGSGLGEFPVPAHEKKQRRSAQSFRQVSTVKRSDGVTVSECKGFTHDPRYHVEPGAKVYGAGFAAVGPGRDVDTGKGWQ
jgi:hypothetical protein